jgi:hypothetical protein
VQAVTTFGAGNAKSRTRESPTEKIPGLGHGAAKTGTTDGAPLHGWANEPATQACNFSSYIQLIDIYLYYR